MNINRIVQVRDGNALDTLREFLAGWWLNYKLDAMFAPMDLPDHSAVAAQVIEDPAELSSFNPFAPVLLDNSAASVSKFVKEHPADRLAAVLRPCELRAYIELQKRGTQQPGTRRPEEPKCVILGFDCLGTYYPADYSRLVEAKSIEEMTREALRQAAEGGLRQQPFRTSCQMCDWPAPRGADMTIGTIGTSPDQYLLIIARDETTDAHLCLEKVTDKLAYESQVARREMVIGAIADTRAGMRKALIEEIQSPRLFGDLGIILAWLANCTLCGKCLEACPLCGEEAGRPFSPNRKTDTGHTLLTDLVSVSRWLASCSGCGMCEEKCSQGVPVALLISALSHAIRSEIRYSAGDPAGHLPWAYA
jgi:formate dehydrogenase subunit beta